MIFFVFRQNFYRNGNVKIRVTQPPSGQRTYVMDIIWTSCKYLILVIWRLSNQMIAFWKFPEVYLMLQWIYSSKIEDLH